VSNYNLPSDILVPAIRRNFFKKMGDRSQLSNAEVKFAFNSAVIGSLLSMVRHGDIEEVRSHRSCNESFSAWLTGSFNGCKNKYIQCNNFGELTEREQAIAECAWKAAWKVLSKEALDEVYANKKPNKFGVTTDDN